MYSICGQRVFLFSISDVLPSEGLACYQARTSHGVAGL